MSKLTCLIIKPGVYLIEFFFMLVLCLSIQLSCHAGNLIPYAKRYVHPLREIPSPTEDAMYYFCLKFHLNVLCQNAKAFLFYFHKIL